MTNDNNFANHLDQASSTFNGKIANLAQMTADIHGRFLSTQRDVELETHAERLVGNVAAAGHGRLLRERALFVVGESGSGKTFALEHLFGRHVAFQPYVNAKGRLTYPLLSLEVRASITRKTLAETIIKQINPGIPLSMRLTEDALYGLLQVQLREYGVVYLHIDEAQHLMKGKDHYNILAVQNLVKSLIDSQWPINIILSGVNELSALLQHDNQLANRSHVMRFHKLEFPANATHVVEWVKTVVEAECGLKATKIIYSEQFAHRLIVASSGAFGTLITLARNACLLAIAHSRTEVSKVHFERAYENKTGCLPQDNPFTVKNFEAIDPSMATADMVESIPTPKAGRQK